MHILRYILGAFAIAIPATWAAITWYPGVDYVQHVVPLLQAGVVALIVLTAVALYTEDDLAERGKTALMIGFLIAVLGPTLYTAGAYAHQRAVSWSDGEVHYHADYEVIVQDNGEYRVPELIDPEEYCKTSAHEATYMCKLNDRTGSTKYHEHDDDRIHLEGTFRQREDATLSAFFEQFNGTLTNERLVYPTNEKVWRVEEDGKTLKILVKRGVGGSRGWCAIGPANEVPQEDVCIDAHTNEPARSPSDYVISPYSRDSRTKPLLDNIFIVYDNRTLSEALTDVRQDDRYQGIPIGGGGGE